MLCWISKGLINVTRDNFIGVTKSQTSEFYSINLLEGSDRSIKIDYTPHEITDFENDFILIKDCFLNTYNGTSVRLFNPPTNANSRSNTSEAPVVSRLRARDSVENSVRTQEEYGSTLDRVREALRSSVEEALSTSSTIPDTHVPSDSTS